MSQEVNTILKTWRIDTAGSTITYATAVRESPQAAFMNSTRALMKIVQNGAAVSVTTIFAIKV